MDITLNGHKIKIDVTVRSSSYNPTLLATVQLNIDDIQIRGYRVMRSEYGDGYFVSPPAFKSKNNSFIWIVNITDRLLWSEIEKSIKQAYMEKAEVEMPTHGEQASIDPDEVPI